LILIKVPSHISLAIL